MSKEFAEEIIRHYFTQLTIGCECIDCKEIECSSHLRFNDKFTTPNDAAYKAIKLALQHPFDHHLCPGVCPLYLDSHLLATLHAFDSTVKTLIVAGDYESRLSEPIRTALKGIFTPGVFPYILLASPNQKLAIDDLAIDDEIIGDFVRLMQHKPDMFDLKTFSQMALDIIYHDPPNTFHHIRALVLILVFDTFFSAKNFKTLLINVLSHIISLPMRTQNIFFRNLINKPRTLRQILDVCQNSLTLFLLNISSETINVDAPEYRTIARFLMRLRDDTSFQSSSPLPAKRFSNDEFTKFVKPEFFYWHQDSCLFHNPAILSLEFKNNIFHIDVNLKQQAETNNAIADQVIQRGANILLHRDELVRNVHLTLTVRRDNIIEDTINGVQQFPANHLGRKLMVSFQGEDGVDAGGVSREYFHLLTAQLFSPDYGMFVLVKNRYYWFNKVNIGIPPIFYRTLGTVVALAVYNSIILPIRFPLLLYKKILNKPISLIDLEEFDPDVYRSMKQMLDMRDNGDDISSLDLNFTVTIDNFGSPQEFPLIEGGDFIDVTNENLQDYIDKYVNWFVNSSIETQFNSFATGFWKLFKGEIFDLFSPDELDILVSGEEVLDWDALHKNAKYSDGYRADSRAVKWFWEIFNTFSNDMKCKFLQFTTGSDRAPVGGLAGLVITIQKINDPSKLPVSHTCFSIFGLPNYRSKGDMMRKITMALTQTEGFGLV